MYEEIPKRKTVCVFLHLCPILILQLKDPFPFLFL